MHRRIFLAAGLALALGASPATRAQDDPTAPATPPAAPNTARAGARAQDPAVGRVAAPGAAVAARPFNDGLFVAAAAASGIAETTISQLALERSRDEQVRRFAQMMVEDHDRTNAQIRELAAARQMPLPAELDVCDEATVAALAGLSGAQFDQEYVKQQAAAHMLAAQLYRAEAMRGRDPQLKAMAEQLLPKLETHLNQACNLAGIPVPAKTRTGAATPAPGAPATPGDATAPADQPTSPAPASGAGAPGAPGRPPR